MWSTSIAFHEFEIIVVQDGKPYRLECSGDLTISELKWKIVKKRNLPYHSFELIFNGISMVGSYTLNHYGVKKNDSIHCIMNENDRHDSQSKEADSIGPSKPPQLRYVASSTPRPHLSLMPTNPVAVINFDTNDLALTEEEVVNRMKFWHRQAMSANFNADTHLVDPMAHYANIDYLERDVIASSEYYRCSGEYDMKDCAYAPYPASLKGYVLDNIPNMAWIRTDELFQGVSSILRSIETPVINKGAASLRKSYAILCTISAMLKHLTERYFSKDSYSILTKDDQPGVAKLVPISQEKIHKLKTSIEKTVSLITADSGTILVIEEILKKYIVPQLRSLGHDMRLVIAIEEMKDLAGILALLRMTVLTLDLALVSYVGSHATPFRSVNGVARSDAPRISCNVDNLRSIVVKRRPLACLDDFLGTEVWIFEVERNESRVAQIGSSDGLKVLTQIDTFGDVWGPVWGVGSTKWPSGVFGQYNLSRGCIVQVPDDTSWVSDIKQCHWYNSTSDSGRQPHGNWLKRSDELLIGGPLHHNKHCPYSLGDFQNDQVGRLAGLGTAPASYRPDTRTLGATAGHNFLNFQLSHTQKRHPGTSIKESVYNTINNNPMAVNINMLNNLYGVEISHHTGNATRIRLRDLFRLDTVDRRLQLYKPNWTNTYWGAAFSMALNNEDPNAMLQVWADEGMREQISGLIGALLKLLHTTGESDQILIAAYFGQQYDDDRQVELRVDLNKWAECLRDSCSSAAYVVIGDRCLHSNQQARRHDRQQDMQKNRLPGRRPYQEQEPQQICDGGKYAQTLFETQIEFQRGQHGIQKIGEHIKIYPHRKYFQVCKINRQEIVLRPTGWIAGLRHTKANEVYTTAVGNMRRRWRAIILAGTKSHGGFSSKRRNVGTRIRRSNKPPPKSCCPIL